MNPQPDNVTSLQSNRSVRCSIIIPHYNYSQCVANAIESVLTQSHSNLECIVVDDASDPVHNEALRQILKHNNDPRLKFIELNQNVGQINAMFKGLELATGEFVGFIDPDDLYEPAFLEVLVNAHLNPKITAAFASCEMGRYRLGGGPITRSYTRFRAKADEAKKYVEYQSNFETFGFHVYYKPWETGWRWASTSGLLFRHDVLKLLKPMHLPVHIKLSGDAYVAYGAQMLGGSLFVDCLLSWRGVHEGNAAHPDLIFSQFQTSLKDDFQSQTGEVKIAAVNSFILNGAKQYIPVSAMGEVITTHFDAQTIHKWIGKSRDMRDLMRRFVSNVTWDA